MRFWASFAQSSMRACVAPCVLLYAPLGHHLFKWCCSLEWVWDPGGFSLLEGHSAFTSHSGWLVPLNLALWMDVAKPRPRKGVKLTASLAHEPQYRELILHRQALTFQLVTFAHVVCSLFQHSNCS